MAAGRRLSGPGQCRARSEDRDRQPQRRIPDLVVTTAPIADEVVWLPAEDVALAVEIVSKGSERTDRWLKPVEYAVAGIPRFWRVETDEKVLQFELRDGAYVQVGLIPLADLRTGPVPTLS